MMVNAEIGKVKLTISASEDEKIRDFWEFVAALIMAVCRVMENERKESESLSE